MNIIRGERLLKMHLKINKIDSIPAPARIFTFVVAFLPVFASYASGIPGFSLADMLLVAFTGLALMQPQINVGNKYTVNLSLLIVGLGMILVFDLLAMLSHDVVVYDVVIRTVRYFFYIFCALFTCKKMLSVALLKKYVMRISVAAAIYIFLQLFLYRTFNYVLKGFIPAFDLYVTDYAGRDYASLYYSQMYRPTSFFLEPAHFARYAVVGVLLFLWNNEIASKDIWKALFVSFGTLLSTSAHGYGLLLIVWLLFALVHVKRIKNQNARLLVVLGILASPFLLMMLFQLPFVKNAIVRVLVGNISDRNTALGGRLSGFAYYFDLSIFHKIFGMGLGSIPDEGWLSSAAYWLYGCGGITFVVYIMFMLYTLLKLSGVKRYIFLLFFILFFSDDAFYSYMCVLFYALTLLNKEVKHEKDTVPGKRVPLG